MSLTKRRGSPSQLRFGSSVTILRLACPSSLREIHRSHSSERRGARYCSCPKAIALGALLVVGIVAGGDRRASNLIMAIKQAVPLLRVADVARSIEWYRGILGFVGNPFPAAPPYEFAILRQGPVELMLRRGSPPSRSKPRQYDWDICLRGDGERFREVFAAFC